MTTVAMVSPYALDVPGGVQDQVLGLAARLTERGLDVSVVGPRLDGGGVGGVARIRANGSVAPISLGPRTWSSVRTMLREVDVIHIHEPFMPLVSWAALSVPTGRRVVTFHADPSGPVRAAYRILRPRKMLGPGTIVTAVSPTAASALAWQPDVRIVPNGVRSIGADASRDMRQVAFLGRDEPRKGLAVLLEAWPLVRARCPDVRLSVMGCDGPDLDGVRFLGRVDEKTKDEQLRLAGIFCAPNLGGESFGITVAEAMSAGCAVVASDLAAFRHVLDDTGALVRPADAGALAADLVGLLDDPERARDMGRRAERRSEIFSWSSVTDAYLELYGIDSAK